MTLDPQVVYAESESIYPSVGHNAFGSSVGPRILKPWVIVYTDITGSLWDVFTGVRDSRVAGLSSFTFPSELRDQSVSCSVSVNIS